MSALALSLDARPVVLIGDNGAGKTNLLEAVSLLGPGQGLRGRGLWRACAEGRPIAAGRSPRGCTRSTDEVEIGTGYGLDRRRGRNRPHRAHRRQGAERSGALADYVQLVWVIPEMDGLFTGPASERRRFLDRLTLAIDPKMRVPRGRFERAMRQRNRLFQMREGSPSHFAGLEEQMAEAALPLPPRASRPSPGSRPHRGDRDTSVLCPFPFAVLQPRRNARKCPAGAARGRGRG